MIEKTLFASGNEAGPTVCRTAVPKDLSETLTSGLAKAIAGPAATLDDSQATRHPPRRGEKSLARAGSYFMRTHLEQINTE